MKLLKSLYGLRQSAHHWNQEINATLLKHGFQCVTLIVAFTFFTIKKENCNVVWQFMLMI